MWNLSRPFRFLERMTMNVIRIFPYADPKQFRIASVYGNNCKTYKILPLVDSLWTVLTVTSGSPKIIQDNIGIKTWIFCGLYIGWFTNHDLIEAYSIQYTIMVWRFPSTIEYKICSFRLSKCCLNVYPSIYPAYIEDYRFCYSINY